MKLIQSYAGNLAPVLYGNRYTSYGRHFTQVEKLEGDSSFLYMGRLLEGFGIGIISYTVPVYIAEISPQNLRGALVSVNQLSVTIGIMLAYLLGLFVQWRYLAILGIIPCTLLIPGLFFIPESPRWLAKMGMTEEFENSLQVLRGYETDISVEVNEIIKL
ncbi:sugar transporter ERD6 [Trifolium repens]|nr:sugar transporter ERD6 [Trifolium repens]